MGVHVLTLASAAVKPTADGQLPEDSATCAWDADPQEAGVLERMRRVSRSMAKTRRDEWLTHRERRGDDVEDGEPLSTRGAQPGGRWVCGLAHSPAPSVFKPATAGTRSEVYPPSSRYLCSYQRPDWSLPGPAARHIRLEDGRARSAQSGHSSRGCHAPPGRR